MAATIYLKCLNTNSTIHVNLFRPFSRYLFVQRRDQGGGHIAHSIALMDYSAMSTYANIGIIRSNYHLLTIQLEYRAKMSIYILDQYILVATNKYDFSSKRLRTFTCRSTFLFRS